MKDINYNGYIATLLKRKYDETDASPDSGEHHPFHPNPNQHKYLQTKQVAFDDQDDEDSDQDEDDDQLESTTPAVRSERPFNYVCNREEKQSLLFRNAQMVNF